MPIFSRTPQRLPECRKESLGHISNNFGDTIFFKKGIPKNLHQFFKNPGRNTQIRLKFGVLIVLPQCSIPTKLQNFRISGFGAIGSQRCNFHSIFNRLYLGSYWSYRKIENIFWNFNLPSFTKNYAQLFPASRSKDRRTLKISCYFL